MPVTISGTGGVSGVDGSAASPSVKGLDANTGVAFAADKLTLSTGGSDRFHIASAGQLGIAGANYGTDGQVLTSTGASSAPAWETVGGGGKVLQWVAGRYTNDRESTTDTSNFVAMPDGLSITPTAASSRILMMVTLSINEDTSGNTWLDFGRTISGGSISRLSGLTNGLTSYGTPTGFITLNMSYVDHPDTTTSTLYQVMIKAGAGTVALNDYSTNTGTSMTLLELGPNS